MKWILTESSARHPGGDVKRSARAARVTRAHTCTERRVFDQRLQKRETSFSRNSGSREEVSEFKTELILTEARETLDK